METFTFAEFNWTIFDKIDEFGCVTFVVNCVIQFVILLLDILEHDLQFQILCIFEDWELSEHLDLLFIEMLGVEMENLFVRFTA